MKEGSKKYNDECIQLALSRIDIAPCCNCGHPNEVGFCCSTCGEGDGQYENDRLDIAYTAKKSC